MSRIVGVDGKYMVVVPCGVKTVAGVVVLIDVEVLAASTSEIMASVYLLMRTLESPGQDTRRIGAEDRGSSELHDAHEGGQRKADTMAEVDVHGSM